MIPGEPPSKSGVKMLSKFAWLTMRSRPIVPGARCERREQRLHRVEALRREAPRLVELRSPGRGSPALPLVETNVRSGVLSGSPNLCSSTPLRRAPMRTGLPVTAAVAAALASLSTAVRPAHAAARRSACATCASSCATSQRPRCGVGVVLVPAEDDVRADGVRPRAQPLRRGGRVVAGVRANAREVDAEPRLEVRAQLPVERLATAARALAASPCWTTCASSCASRRRPSSLDGVVAPGREDDVLADGERGGVDRPRRSRRRARRRARGRARSRGRSAPPSTGARRARAAGPRSRARRRRSRAPAARPTATRAPAAPACPPPSSARPPAVVARRAGRERDRELLRADVRLDELVLLAPSPPPSGSRA